MMRSPAPGPAPLLIRADASARMGTGHVMRCLALAQAWQKHGPVVFACAELTSALGARLAGESCQVKRLDAIPGSPQDSADTLDLARQLGASWLVLDGYQFDSSFQRAIKEGGLRLLAFDDYGHVPDPCADLVLNQNLGATAALYPGHGMGTRLLLGTRYALLRKEFLAWRDWQREIPLVARKVLVTLGGADPDNVTARVVEALARLDVEAKIVVGGSNPHHEALSFVVRPPSSVLRDASNMPELMAWADVAVAAGGSTSWELAFMGLPSVVLTLADNQAMAITALETTGTSWRVPQSDCTAESLAPMTQALLQNGNERAHMSNLGRSLVDGLGANRVLTEMWAAAVTLRDARPSDCRQVWEWANDPAVRAASFKSNPIPWESHERWFEKRLQDDEGAFFIAEDESGLPLGQVRFDLEDTVAVISISLDARCRGRGHSSAIIIAAVRRFAQTHETSCVHAFTKPDNLASVRAFERAGFICRGPTNVDSHPAIELVWNNV